MVDFLERARQGYKPASPAEEEFWNAENSGEFENFFKELPKNFNELPEDFKEKNGERKNYLIYAINFLPVYVENEEILENLTLDSLFAHLMATWQKLESDGRLGIKNDQNVSKEGIQKLANALYELIKDGGHGKDGLDSILTLLGKKLEEVEFLLSN